MALRILYPGDRYSLSTLAADAYTRQNYGAAGMTSSRITADTPDGALGGMVAKATGNYENGVYDTPGEQALGFFINDVAGSPFENTPSVASGKCPIMTNQGSYETDIYETRDAADSADLTYAVGDLLYASANGLLTNEDVGGNLVCGVCTKAPTATDPFLGFNSKV